MLGLGVTLGVIGAIMFFTVNIPYDNPGTDGPGQGNARVSVDEEVLGRIVAEELSEFAGFGPGTTVGVRILTRGVVELSIGVGASPAGSINLELDPEVIDGRLELAVTRAQVGGLIAPREIANAIEQQLQTRLDGAAVGFDYRLIAIVTTDQRLTLEIEM